MQVLVELAMERDQDTPALIYEGRSTVRPAWNCLCFGLVLLCWACYCGAHLISLPVLNTAFRVTTHDAQALLILKLQAVTCMAMYECS